LGRAVLVAVVALLLPISSAAAQEQGQTVREDAGPYSVEATVIPSGDIVRVAATVLEAETEAAASNAQVIVRTHRAADGESGWVRALANPQRPGLYEAVVELGAGEWALSLEVSGPQGGADVTLPSVTVAPALDPFPGELVIYAVSLVIAAGAVYVWWSSRRALRKQALATAPPSAKGPGAR
jgi:hypothetical protein